ncbi:MAG: hypothetical protein M3Q93_11120 [Gemmatimonadota bacterium]|nr:hypothetical protein [Gemmatimonadota bacterium]
MRVTHYARRSLGAGALALALAACANDTGPSDFNAQGTTADMAAAQGAFASAQATSFTAIGADISGVMGGSPLVASSARLAMTGPSAASARYARQLAAFAPRAGRGIQASAASMPSEVLGKTFVWDESADQYVVSGEAGAPATGVRFLLYAVDPVQLRPVEPVVEVGYVDIIDQSTATATDFRIKVVEGSVVYLDYDVAASSSASTGIVTISGFASNGSTIANFDLRNTISENAGGLVLSLDYDLTVPSRDGALNWSATFANISETEVVVTLDLAISGPNGQVRLLGTYGVDGGSLSVKVNGDPFATITLVEGGATITGAGGAALTAEEEATLETILDYYEVSLTVFAELVAPLD